MATVEFGQPSSLLFPTGLMEDLREITPETSGEDAFIPTGLLLQQVSVTQDSVEIDEERVAGRSEFGGTSGSRHEPMPIPECSTLYGVDRCPFTIPRRHFS